MASQTEIGYVYKITSPTGRIYIGSTNNINNRELSYARLKKDRQRRLYNSIKKYGWDNHIFEVIDKCEFSQVTKLEAKYGHQFEVLGRNGLNCKLPKSDEEKKCISEQTRSRMSASMMGNKNGIGYKKTPESEAKRIETRKKNFKGTSAETREKQRIAHLGQSRPGRKMPQSQKDHLSLLNKGKKQSAETIQKGILKRYKIVFDQQTGIYYESVLEAYSCYRHSYRYTIQMLCGRKRNQTNLIYA